MQRTGQNADQNADQSAAQNAYLHCHPATPCDAVSAIAVRAGRTHSGLQLRYTLLAVPELLWLPEPSYPVRRDELWRHTCAELFVSLPSGDAYVEFNFSPSGEWAAYQFDAYRQGMRPLDVTAPVIEMTMHDAALRIEVSCELPPAWRAAPLLKVGMTMVIEDLQGLIAYWSLQHPAGKPDFHHRDGFVLEL